MILSAHQPAYLPWLGYFEKISRADVFVYLDTVQYEKNSFINRNRIKTPQGALWLTIPVKSKGHTSASLLTTQIDESQAWRVKHLKAIEMNYGKGRQFKKRFERLEKIINIQEQNLSEYCFQHLQFWLKELRIDTKIFRSSDLSVDSSKSDLVLDYCRYFGADQYLSGALGKNYLVKDDFDRAKIDIQYQDFVALYYSQLWDGDFIPNLSVVDWWMNE